MRPNAGTVRVNVHLLEPDEPKLFAPNDKGFQFYLGEWPAASFSTSARFERKPVGPPICRDSPLRMEKILQLSKTWLTNCLIDHPSCAKELGEHAACWPTRLIDVGPSQGRLRPRFVLSTSLSQDLSSSMEASIWRNQYTTLSYCWGPQGHLAITTSENLRERMRGIDLASLPKISQEAIELTRDLGVKYIWIDALCIIQPTNGDTSDWERKAPLMDKVYRNSLCTIAASGAANCNVGCFRRRRAAELPISGVVIPDPNHVTTGRSPITVRLNSRCGA